MSKVYGIYLCLNKYNQNLSFFYFLGRSWSHDPLTGHCFLILLPGHTMLRRSAQSSIWRAVVRQVGHQTFRMHGPPTLLLESLRSLGPSIPKRTHSVSSDPRKLLPGDWVCRVCESHNLAKHAPHCQACGAETKVAVRPGDWKCPGCNHYNFSYRSQCQRCKSPAPSVSGSVEAYGSNWTCPGCGRVNTSHPVCSGCRIHRKASVPGMEWRPGDWTCPGCHAHNYSRRSSCYRCNTPIPQPEVEGEEGEGEAVTSRRSASAPRIMDEEGQTIPRGRRDLPGDWKCPDCGFHNFAVRYTCRRCTSARLPTT